MQTHAKQHTLDSYIYLYITFKHIYKIKIETSKPIKQKQQIIRRKSIIKQEQIKYKHITHRIYTQNIFKYITHENYTKQKSTNKVTEHMQTQHQHTLKHNHTQKQIKNIEH